MAWKFKVFYGSDPDLDPFLAKNAKSAKELGRFSIPLFVPFRVFRGQSSLAAPFKTGMME
jgi:hypothetical protein